MATLHENPRDLDDDELFDAVFDVPGVPLLKHLILMARGWQMGSPWALLGRAGGVAACDQPKSSVYAGMASPAPLNLLLGFVGISGMGKGLIMGAPLTPHSFAAVNAPAVGGQINTGPRLRFAHPASGEQLVTEFFDEFPDPTYSGTGTPPMIRRQHDDPVWVDWAEIDAMAAKMKVTAATLEAFLRSVYSGETFGDRSLGRMKMGLGQIVEKMSYRCVVSVGVQPSRAAALIRDGGGGTIQRYQFFPVDDPYAASVPELLPLRQELCRRLGAPIPTDRDTAPPALYIHGPASAALNATVRDTLSAIRYETLSGTGRIAAEDTHQINSQARWAAIIAGWKAQPGTHVVVDEDDWFWSGCLLERSRRVRNSITEAAEKSDAEEAARRGKNQHITNRAAAEAKEAEEAAFMESVHARVQVILRQRPGLTYRDIFVTLGAKQRKVLRTILANGIDESRLIADETGRYFVVSQ